MVSFREKIVFDPTAFIEKLPKKDSRKKTIIAYMNLSEKRRLSFEKKP
jgi:hypothetical protein